MITKEKLIGLGFTFFDYKDSNISYTDWELRLQNELKLQVCMIHSINRFKENSLTVTLFEGEDTCIDIPIKTDFDLGILVKLLKKS